MADDVFARYNRMNAISDAAEANGVRPELAHAMIQQESGGNPNAVSPAGAFGLTQVMPATAAQPGYGVKPFDSHDPQQNLNGGLAVLGAYIKHFGGDEQKGLAAYNAGPGRVEKGGALPTETQKYVPTVLGKAGEGAPKQDVFARYNAMVAENDARDAAQKQHKEAPTEAPEPEGAVSRFAKGAWENLNPAGLIDFAKQAYNDPIGTGKGLVNAQLDQFRKAKEDYDQGHYSEMIGHGAAGALPLLGPAAARAGETIASGDIAGGLGQGAGLLVGSELGKVMPKGINPNVGRAGELVGDVLKAPVTAVDALGNKVNNMARAVPERLMDSAHKFTPKERMANPGVKLGRIAVDEGIQPGLPGATKATGKITAIEGMKQDLYQKYGSQPMDFARNALADLKAQRAHLAQGAAPGANLAVIDGLIDEIANNPQLSRKITKTVMVPTPTQVQFKTPLGGMATKTVMQDVPTQVPAGRVPIQSGTNAVLGAMKEENANVRGTYGVSNGPIRVEKVGRQAIRRVASQSLKDAYDPLVTAENEAKNSGIMGSIRSLVSKDAPTLSDLQKREGGLIALQKATTRGAARVSNLNPVSLTSTILGSAGAGAAAGPFGAVGGGLAGAIAGHIISKPASLARMARIVNVPIEAAGKTTRAIRGAAPAVAGANAARNSITRPVTKSEVEQMQELLNR